MAIDRKQLLTLLFQGPVVVTFTKKDGTQRVMKCTLHEDAVVPYEKTTDRVKQQNDSVCPVWDLDKQQWRSFTYDSVMEFYSA